MGEVRCPRIPPIAPGLRLVQRRNRFLAALQTLAQRPGLGFKLHFPGEKIRDAHRLSSCIARASKRLISSERVNDVPCSIAASIFANICGGRRMTTGSDDRGRGGRPSVMLKCYDRSVFSRNTAFLAWPIGTSLWHASAALRTRPRRWRRWTVSPRSALRHGRKPGHIAVE